MKGVSSVIAAILLLLVTIAIVGFVFSFFMRAVQTPTAGAEQQLVQQQQQYSTIFQIEGVYTNQVYIRNSGTAPLTNLAFFVNGIPVDYIGPSSLDQNGIGTYILNDAQLSAIPNPSRLRITSSGWVNEMAVTTLSSPGSVPDTTPPVRSGGLPAGTLPAGTTSATISLTTNETAKCKYSTAPGVPYDSMAVFSSTDSTFHSQSVSGLSDGNTYYYYVKCQDTLGNTNTDDFIITFSIGIAAMPSVDNYTLFANNAGANTNDAYSNMYDYYFASKNGSSFTTDGSGIDWSNPSNANASDSVYTTSVLTSTSSLSSVLKVTGFGLSIPSGAIITGVNVNIKRHSSTSTVTNNITDNSVQLIKGGTIQGNNKALTSIRHATGDSIRSYGNYSDMWGLTLTPADVNSANFGVSFSVLGRTSTSITSSVDYINITVFYTLSTTFSLMARVDGMNLDKCYIIQNKYIFVGMSDDFDFSKLYMASSLDGLTFRNLNMSGGSIYSGKDGLNVIDSDILYYQNKYYLVYHQRLANLSIATSTDLLHWSELVEVVPTNITDYGISDPFWVIDNNGNVHIIYQIGSLDENGTFVNKYTEVHPKSSDASTWGIWSNWADPVDIKDYSGNKITDGGDSFIINNTNSDYVMIYTNGTKWKKRTASNLTNGWSDNNITLEDLVGGEQPSMFLLPNGTIRLYISDVNYQNVKIVMQESLDSNFLTWGSQVNITLVNFSRTEGYTITWGKFRNLPVTSVTTPINGVCKWELPPNAVTQSLLIYVNTTAGTTSNTLFSFLLTNTSYVYVSPNIINQTFTLQNNGAKPLFFQLNITDPAFYISRLSPQSFNSSVPVISSVDSIGSWLIS